MKKAGLLALVVIVATALAAIAEAKAKRVASEVEVTGWYFEDSEDNDFIMVGDVHANKPKCEKNRTVTVYEQNELSDPRVVVATVTTDKTGDWSRNYGSDFPGNYTSADVDRKKIEKRKKNLVCKADSSPPLVTD
jgi:ABC-type glycerol-3-phosphate transport system substrate-binding protein